MQYHTNNKNQELSQHNNPMNNQSAAVANINH
jgi:hypothetical protein